MKLASFLLGLSTASSVIREITNQCSPNVGEEATLTFGTGAYVERVTLTIPAEKKKDYKGLVVRIHHSSYDKPKRCGSKDSGVNYGSPRAWYY